MAPVAERNERAVIGELHFGPIHTVDRADELEREANGGKTVSPVKELN
jgi:hypothetical protein